MPAVVTVQERGRIFCTITAKTGKKKILNFLNVDLHPPPLVRVPSVK